MLIANVHELRWNQTVDYNTSLIFLFYMFMRFYALSSLHSIVGYIKIVVTYTVDLTKHRILRIHLIFCAKAPLLKPPF